MTHKALRLGLVYVAMLAAGTLVIGLFSCHSVLVPERTISVEYAGPVILDALDWAEASIPRDPELLPAERETALRSVALAREIVEKASR